MCPGAAEKGTFDRVPFSVLIVRALDQRWTGTLFVDPPDGLRHLVQLHRGLTVRVRVPDDYAMLGSLLVEAGIVMEAEVALALPQNPTEPGPLVGQALLDSGQLDQHTLGRMLLSQLLARLVRIFTFPPETAYSYWAGHDAFAGDRSTPLRIDPLRVLWAGLRKHGEHPYAMAATLDPILNRPFILRPEGQVSRYGFDDDAKAVVEEMLEGPLTLSELVARGVAPEQVCRRVVYALRICRFLDFSAKVAEMHEQLGSARHKQPRQVARVNLRRVSVPRGAARVAPNSAEHLDFSVKDEVAPRPKSPPSSSSRPPSAADSSPSSVPPPSSSRPSPPAASESSSELQSASPASASSHAQAQAVARRRAAIEGRVADLATATPWELLNLSERSLQGVDESERVNALWRAYEASSRDWHPDLCPEPLADQRANLVQICTAITRAFETLLERTTRPGALDRDGRDE